MEERIVSFGAVLRGVVNDPEEVEDCPPGLPDG